MNFNDILIFLIGAFIGYVGGYAGIAGAPFLVAISVIVFGFSQYEAQGTILAVMLGPMSLGAVIAFYDRVKVLKWYIVSGVVSYAVFSYFGAVGAYAVNEVNLKIFFGILLIVMGINDLILSRKFTGNNNELNPEDITISEGKIPVNLLSITGIAILIGVVGGFFGIGAGVLMVPVFTNILKIHKDDARALSLAILLPPVSIGAVIKYQSFGDVNWKTVALLFIAYFLTNYFGAKKGSEHSPEKFKMYFGLIMIMLGISYFFVVL